MNNKNMSKQAIYYSSLISCKQRCSCAVCLLVHAMLVLWPILVFWLTGYRDNTSQEVVDSKNSNFVSDY